MSSLTDELLIAFHRIWDRKWIVLAVAWGVCVLGWLAVSLIPNKYESRARVFVQTQSVLQGKMGITPLEQQANLDSMRQTLTSTANLEKVVRGTDLIKTAASPREVNGRIAMLRTNIKVVAQANNLFEISATMSDSGLSDRKNALIAGQVVARLIDVFQQENVAGGANETRQSLSFLDQQIADQGKKLRDAEMARNQYSARFDGVLPGAGTLSQRIDAAQVEINQLDTQLMGAQSALAAINAQLAGTPPTFTTGGTGGSNPALAAAMAELGQARARGWTDSHPDVIAIKRQIEMARASGGISGTAGTSTPNPAYSSLRSMQAERAATVQAISARKAQLQAQLATFQGGASEAGIVTEQGNLEQQYAAIKAQYDKLISDRQDVQLRGAVQSEASSITFRVIDPPGIPSAPASPNRPLLFIGVLLVGVGAGVGVAFVMGQLTNSFSTAIRLEKVAGVPVLGSISEARTSRQILQDKLATRRFALGGGALAAACVGLILVEFVQRTMA